MPGDTGNNSNTEHYIRGESSNDGRSNELIANSDQAFPKTLTKFIICRNAGVNTLQVNPDGQSLAERLATLARLIELLRAPRTKVTGVLSLRSTLPTFLV
jgi:hypothetical protein